MKMNLLLVSIITLLTIKVAFSQKYSGVVFLDANANGIKDINEEGIKDVLISDGLHVVKTDKYGKYTLKGFDNFNFIMAHIPANYKTKKYYHPLKKGIRTYNFAFKPKEKKDNFKFVHVSDTETYEYRDWLNLLKEYAKNETPDFIMHTGDICYKRGMDFHAKNVTEKTLGVPVKYSIGNHDLVAGDYGEQFYEQHFGPVYYSFEEGNVLFISTPMLHGDYKPKYTKKQVYHYLKNLLKHFSKKQPKIIYNHDLLTEKDTFLYGISKNEVINLNDYNLKAWIYGHYHNNNIKEHGASGIKSICTASPVMGGIDHSPSMFRIVHVDKDGTIETELRYTAINKKIKVLTPTQNQVCKLVDGYLPISVNTYHSASKVDSVRYSISNSDFHPSWHDLKVSEGWQPMQQTTSFNWKANWKPEVDAEGKEYSIRAQAFLSNGNVIRTKENFVYTKNTTIANIGKNWENLLENAQHTGDASRVVKPPLKMFWVNNAGASIFMSSPVVAEGKVFVATMDDDNYKKRAILAYDVNTGKQLWQYKIEGSIKNAIAFSNGNIIATDSKGITYAINGNSGKLSWKTNLDYNRMPPFVSGIVTHNNSVYTGFGNALSALNTVSGKVLWKNKDWNNGEGSVPTLTLADNVLIASSHWVSLFGHDAKTGKLLWKNKDLRFRDATTIFKDGKLYVGSRNKLFILNHKTGKPIKSKETKFQFSVSSAPLVTNDLIIMATSDNGIAAFNKDNFELVWNYKTKPALIYTSPYTKTNERTVESSPVLSGDIIYFGASDGYFYALDVKSGNEVWKIDVGVPIFSTAAISGNLVFVNDFSGNTYAFTSENK